MTQMDWLDGSIQPRCAGCRTVMVLDAGAYRCRGCGRDEQLESDVKHPGAGDGLLQFPGS